MIEVAATDQPEPRIDVCRLCHFVWFDAEEINHFAPLPPISKPADLPRKARERFALARFKKMASEPADNWWKQLGDFLALPMDS
jgi:hypothetical protein